MSSLDLIRMAFQNLWRRKLRTFLTVLGVVIGTTSIIVMLSLGLGMKQTNRDMIESMGDLTAITVTPSGTAANPYGGDPGSSNRDSRKTILNDTSIVEFKQIPGVIGASPVIDLNMEVKYRKYSSFVTITGIDPVMMNMMNMTLEEGRLLTPGDNMNAVFGGQVGNNFYDPNSSNYRPVETNPLRDKYSITFDGEEENKEYDIQVVGVLSENDWSTAWNVYMPLKDVEQLQREKPKDPYASGQEQRQARGTYQKAQVKVEDISDVEYVQEEIKSMGYNTYSLQDQVKEFEQGTNIIQAILGGIGGISLLVAAIGITNTMIMSIYERTKEIGVMKVIGAAIDDIKKLFLVEAAFIGLAGGILGSAFSLAISSLLNYLFQSSGVAGDDVTIRISIIPLWLVLVALVFSAAIGLVSGYLPARRAMKLSALEAIRTE